MDINQTIERLVALHDGGGNPSQMMQSMFSNNYQVGQMKTQLQNMAQGRSPKDFILQLAQQYGASEQNLQNLSRILSGK